MNDDRDIPFDRLRATLDVVNSINQLINMDIPIGNLDPPNLSEIVDFNLRHLQLETNKGGFPDEYVYLIENAIKDANNYITNNPIDGGGGGGNNGIINFTDCYKGFIFAIDFGSKVPKTINGGVYYISVNGYNGCATVSLVDKKPTLYNGSDYKIFDPQIDCTACMRKFGIG